MEVNNENVFQHKNPFDVDLVIQNICKKYLTINDLKNVRLISKRWDTIALQQLKRENYGPSTMTPIKVKNFVRAFTKYLTPISEPGHDLPFSKLEVKIPLSIMEYYFSNPDTISDKSKTHNFVHNFGSKIRYLKIEVSKDESESKLLKNGFLFRIFTNLLELEIDFINKHTYSAKFKKLLKIEPRINSNIEETTTAPILSKLSFGLASTLGLLNHFDEEFFQVFLKTIPNLKSITFTSYGFHLPNKFLNTLVINKTDCSQISMIQAPLDNDSITHLVSLSQFNNLRLKVIKIQQTDFMTNNEFCELLRLNSSTLKVVKVCSLRNLSSDPTLLSNVSNKMENLVELDMIITTFISPERCFFFAEAFKNLKKLVLTDGCNYSDLVPNHNGDVALPFIFIEKFWNDLQHNNRPLLTLKDLTVDFEIRDKDKMQDLINTFPSVIKVQLMIKNDAAKNICKSIWTNENWSKNIIEMTLKMRNYESKYRSIDPALIGLKRLKCAEFRKNPNKFDCNLVQPIDSMLNMTRLQRLILQGDFEISDATGFLIFSKMKELKEVLAKPNNNYHPFLSNSCRKLLKGKVAIRGVSLVQHPMYS